MLSFLRREHKVIVKLEHGIFFNDQHFELEIIQMQQYQAELLRKQFQTHMERNLERIRIEAYNQGWKDAKAKTKKRTWFTGVWK